MGLVEVCVNWPKKENELSEIIWIKYFFSLIFYMIETPISYYNSFVHFNS